MPLPDIVDRSKKKMCLFMNVNGKMRPVERRRWFCKCHNVLPVQ
jgi:hypothetical protein